MSRFAILAGRRIATIGRDDRIAVTSLSRPFFQRSLSAPLPVMNSEPLATDTLVSPRLRSSARSTYLNSRLGSSRQTPISTIAQLEEMMTVTSAELPVTSTMRLLEVSCGLSHDEIERLLVSPPLPSAPTVSEPAAQAGFFRRVGAIVLTLCLAGGAAAFLIAVS
jgi:hypothetical protein